MHDWAARAALIWLLSFREAGVAPTVRAPTQLPANVTLAQFWEDPGDVASWDLMAGPTLLAMPDASLPFSHQSTKSSGFSPGYDVKDAAGREWSVKMGPEAQSEVVASRLLWAAGYHQPPTYYLPAWTLTGGPSPGVQGGARFRPKEPLKSAGSWRWQKNPFVGTQPYRGLIVLMLLVNSTDLRNDNNVIYTVKRDDATVRWYVVKDLGATLGETGIHRPRRNYLEGFEQESFVTTNDKGRQRFAYRGLYKELLGQVSDEDVRWASARLASLSDRQWHDAFRAGGYPDDLAEHYITALRARVDAGLRIADMNVGARSDYWATRQRHKVTQIIRTMPRFVGGQFKRLLPD